MCVCVCVYVRVCMYVRACVCVCEQYVSVFSPLQDDKLQAKKCALFLVMGHMIKSHVTSKWHLKFFNFFCFSQYFARALVRN